MILDIVILVVLGKTIYDGYVNGIISTIFYIVGIVLGVIVAWLFFDFSKDLINQYFPLGSPWTEIVAALIPIGLVVVLVIYIGKLVKLLIDLVTLGIADKLFGVLLGIIKGLILLGIFFIFLEKITGLLGWDNAFHSSYLYPIIKPATEFIFEAILSLVPHLRKLYDKGIEKVI